MSLHAPRRFALAVLIALTGSFALVETVAAFQQGGQVQPCDGVYRSRTFPAGSVQRTGSTAAEARENAVDAASSGIEQQLPRCSNLCPEWPYRCLFVIHFDWPGWNVTEPTLNPLTGEWSCTVSWTAVVTEKKCKPCL